MNANYSFKIVSVFRELMIIIKPITIEVKPYIYPRKVNTVMVHCTWNPLELTGTNH